MLDRINHLALVALFAALLAMPGAAHGQVTWYVDDDAPGDPGPGDPTVSDPLEDGSATHPFDAIQEGISAASPADTVLVLDGTYTGTGNKNLDFGGKAITVVSENGPASCIIDCQGSGCGFIFDDGETATVIVDGFTIADANGNYGAGVNCTNGSNPTISNCIITGCHAANGGGGVNSGTGTGPTLVNCIITGNTSNAEGGGLRGNESTATLVNCTLADNDGANDGSGNGGGVHLRGSSNVVMANCVLSGNAASQGPEGNVVDSSTLTISYSDVDGGLAEIYVSSNSTLNWGDGMIDAVPAIYDGMHLGVGSPCIDAGTNDPPGGLPPTDFEGDPRPIDGDGGVEPWTGQAETADMGADEFEFPTTPLIGVSPGALEFSALEGGPDPNDQTLSIWNCGIDTLNWQIVEACSWLVVDPNSGQSAGETDEVTVSVDIVGMMGGVYECALEIVDPQAENSPRTVNVTLQVFGILSVPSEYATIQAAIDAAVEGEIVLVADGTYTGTGNKDLDFGGKDITVMSENGAATCIIDCENSGRGFYFHSGESGEAVVDGFTIKRGNVGSSRGGGVRCGGGGSRPTVLNCVITECNGVLGGGVYCYQSAATFVDCVISGNEASDDGGGICTENCSPTFDRCVISDNSCSDNGGGVHSYAGGSPKFVNCLIVDNRAPGDAGGGICAWSGVSVVNCTFVGNTAGNGGGLHVNINSHVHVYNSVFSGNTASATGPEISVQGQNYPSVLTIAYTDVDGGLAEVAVHSACTLNWGDGMIDADPLFADPGSADYHLAPGSPCIDAGTNSPPDGLPTTDFEGDPRPVDGDGDVEPWTGQAETADMGADEAEAPTTPLLCVSPTEFTFTAPLGGPDPNDQTLSIWNCGADTLDWKVVEACAWLDADPNNGQSTGETDEATLSVDVTGLSAGQYVCDIDIVDPEAPNSPRTVNVTLNVLAPEICFAPTDFYFVAPEGGPNPEDRMLSIWNCSLGTLNWDALEACAWLDVDPSSGHSSGAPTAVTLSVDVTGLSPGQYVCDLDIVDPMASNSPQTVPVTLDVLGPEICLSPSDFTFMALEAGPDPNDQTLSIWNCGVGTLDWEVIEDCSWLEADPSSGDSMGEIDEITLSVNVAGLSHGMYTCMADVADPDATNSPQQVDVTLYVTDELLVPSEYATIQSAIDGALERDTVLVADGTYTGTGNKNLDFAGKAITVRSENGPNNCTIDCETDGRGFYFHSGETADSVVDGFTIVSGRVTLDSPGNANGGGIYCYNASPTIAGCIITGCEAYDSDDPNIPASHGGGIACRNQASPRIIDCTVSANQTRLGGGLACEGGSSPTITNCTITGNTDHAGGIYCWDGCNPDISYCTISANASDGVYCYYSSPKIRNCLIAGNTGRGLQCAAGANAVVSNCEFVGNAAEDGGAILCTVASAPTIVNCTIYGNQASDDGGAIYSTVDGSSGKPVPTLINCILWGNQAPDGPQIAVNYTGGMSNRPKVVVSHCDVQGGAGDVYLRNSYCSVKWVGVTLDADPLFVDPDGLDDDPNTFEDNDYHLATGSPCIDAGCNCGLPADSADLDNDGDTNELTPIDLDGEGRFFDDPNTPETGNSWAPIVDMGAYEFGGTGAQPCVGDLDNDRDIDLGDLAALLGAYGTGTAGDHTNGDLDCDGDVQLADLATLLGVYGTSCP